MSTGTSSLAKAGTIPDGLRDRVVGVGRPPVSDATIRAYAGSTYYAGQIAVRIGQRNAALDDWLSHQRPRSAVFLTASNPFSRRMPGGWNQRMVRKLLCCLRGLPLLPGGSGTGGWFEQQVLVAVDLPRAVVLARRFRQHAVVAVALRHPARLVLDR